MFYYGINIIYPTMINIFFSESLLPSCFSLLSR